LSLACRRLSQILADDDAIYRAFCIRFKSINYKDPSLSWKALFLSKDIQDMCIHLSDITASSLSHDIQPRYQERALRGEITCDACPHTLPDIWFCLASSCGTLGCGRSQRKHALIHSEEAKHPITLKLSTLEAWCYSCKKWLGVFDAPLSERHQVKWMLQSLAQNPDLELNAVRQRERNIFGLEREDPLALISSNWFMQWRSFLLGNAGRPGPMDNTHLFDQNERLRADIDYFLDYTFLSEENYWKLHGIYGGGPPIIEREIESRPEYDHIRFQLASWRKYAHCTRHPSQIERAANDICAE
jgi:hypothetical protein